MMLIVELCALLEEREREFRADLWHKKTRVPGVSCGFVHVILRLAVLVELRLVTDTGPWLVPRMHSIVR